MTTNSSPPDPESLPLSEELQFKWHRLLKIYHAICPDTYRCLCKFKERHAIAVICTLEGYSYDRIANLQHYTNSNVRLALKEANELLGLHDVSSDMDRIVNGIPKSKTVNHQFLITRKFALYVALENFPNAEVLVNEILNRNRSLGQSGGSVEFIGTYEVVDELILRAILPAQKLSRSENSIRIIRTQ